MLDHRQDDGSRARPPATNDAPPPPRSAEPPDYAAEYSAELDEEHAAPSSEGRDHYDLGNVYREMQLWDAAAAEFEQARHDPTLRLRATLALAECLQQTNSLAAALEILEGEGRNGAGSPQERINLHFQLGVTYELLGNFSESLQQFETVLHHNPRHAAAEEKIQTLRKRIGAETSKS